MFVGFNLSTNNNFEDYKYEGERIFESNKAEITQSLEKYLDAKGKIDGTMLQSNWFPQIECDIFLSHAHKDEGLAKGLAGWLKQMFGLKVFIDSCVWGYSLELQKSLDDTYNEIEKGKIPKVYDYQKVLYSTSHVHMMLSTALTMMMDKTESVFLLNTPNVITTKNTIEHTESPWLYHEIAMTQLVRKRDLSEYRNTELLKKGYYTESSLNIKYKVDTSHLHDLNQTDLEIWAKDFCGNSNKEYPLDTLYENKKIVEFTY